MSSSFLTLRKKIKRALMSKGLFQFIWKEIKKGLK
jgi:hypothetical protein